MGKIVSIHSFRGGTGKSNTTANLAATLASQGKRVAIIDTDIQSPGIHVLFGLDESSIGRTLNDYLWNRCSIEEAAHDVSDVLNSSGGSLFLIPSSIKASEIARILREGYDVARLNEGYRDAASRLNLDYLFIDTHPGLNEETLLSIAVSDVLMIILRPDRQDFQGTAVTVDVARKLDVPNLLLVLNMVLPEIDREDLRRQVEANYQATAAGILPLSDDMVRNASSGIFSHQYPEHPWSQELRSIAAQIEA